MVQVGSFEVFSFIANTAGRKPRLDSGESRYVLKPFKLTVDRPETQLEEPVSNYGSILAYDENGYVDYNDVLDEYDEANEIATQEAGVLFMDNLQEQTGRTGYALAGWRPRKNGMKAQAVEWWNWGMSHSNLRFIELTSSPDWENAHSLEESSFAFGIAGGNLTFNQFSEANNLVIDPRGYSAIISGEASTFLKESDPHLRLNIEVKNIEYSKNGITVHNTDGYCVSATYATFTFSLGVLQSKTAISPPRFRFGNGQPSRSSTWAPTRKANCSPTKPSGQMRQSISSTQTPSPAVTILSGNRCLRTISPRSQTSYSQPLSTTNPPASKTSRTKKPKEKPWPPSATCSPADDIPEPAAFTYTR